MISSPLSECKIVKSNAKLAIYFGTRKDILEKQRAADAQNSEIRAINSDIAHIHEDEEVII